MEPAAGDAALFDDYWREVGRDRARSALGMTVAMALGMQVVFIFLDRFAYPEDFPFFLTLRMGVNALLVAILVWGRWRLPRVSMNVFCLAIGLEILAMVYATHAPTSDYYGGLMLLMVGMPVLLPLSSREALGICSLLCAGFAVSPLLVDGPTPWVTYTIHLFLLVSCLVESTLASGFLSRVRVNEFAHRREVERARDHLKQLDVAKSRFTANVHHELRTPLTLMLAPLEAMQSGAFGDVPATLNGYLDTMRVNGLRLLKLINNLLDLAKVESRQIQLHRRALDLPRLIEDLATGARPMAERKQVELVTSCADDLPALHADPDAVEKILVNLLGNALKFTEAGGRIELIAERDGETTHVCVRDTGIGIPPDQTDRVFDRFAQVDASATRTHEGTGIGLSLAKELTELHGGRIWCESDGLGTGTRMHLRLPVGEADAEAVEEMLETSDEDERTQTLQHSFQSLAAEQHIDSEESEQYRVLELQRSVERWEAGDGPERPATAPSGDAERPEVLIAEDNPDMRKLLADLLSSEFRVRTTRNGREALEAVRERQPELILTDVMMPEMSGTELCRAVKEDPELSGIPVVLVTSKAEREMKIGGLEMGADDYVTKPFHPRELLARVRSFVRLRVLQEQLAERNRDLQRALDELRAAQAQLVQREKMASLGQLVAGVAHEINNPVNFIQGNLYYLEEYVHALAEVLARYDRALADADPALREELAAMRSGADLDRILEDLSSVFEGCREGVERTTRIVSDLRTFSRLDYSEVTHADLHENLESTLNLLRDRLKAVEVERDYGELPRVECLAGQINQVFMNLLGNALDAMPGGGTLTVRTEPVGRDAIAIEIEDTGEGIEPDKLERIFDPFFTTKAVGKGTGLGLSLSYGIVERHGGRITVRSEPGAGTCFRIELPVAMKTPAEGAPADPDSDRPAEPPAVADEVE